MKKLTLIFIVVLSIVVFLFLVPVFSPNIYILSSDQINLPQQVPEFVIHEQGQDYSTSSSPQIMFGARITYCSQPIVVGNENRFFVFVDVNPDYNTVSILNISRPIFGLERLSLAEPGQSGITYNREKNQIVVNAKKTVFIIKSDSTQPLKITSDTFGTGVFELPDIETCAEALNLVAYSQSKKVVDYLDEKDLLADLDELNMLQFEFLLPPEEFDLNDSSEFYSEKNMALLGEGLVEQSVMFVGLAGLEEETTQSGRVESFDFKNKIDFKNNFVYNILTVAEKAEMEQRIFALRDMKISGKPLVDFVVNDYASKFTDGSNDPLKIKGVYVSGSYLYANDPHDLDVKVIFDSEKEIKPKEGFRAIDLYKLVFPDSYFGPKPVEAEIEVYTTGDLKRSDKINIKSSSKIYFLTSGTELYGRSILIAGTNFENDMVPSKADLMLDARKLIFTRASEFIDNELGGRELDSVKTAKRLFDGNAVLYNVVTEDVLKQKIFQTQRALIGIINGFEDKQSEVSKLENQKVIAESLTLLDKNIKKQLLEWSVDKPGATRRIVESLLTETGKIYREIFYEVTNLYFEKNQFEEKMMYQELVVEKGGFGEKTILLAKELVKQVPEDVTINELKILLSNPLLDQTTLFEKDIEKNVKLAIKELYEQRSLGKLKIIDKKISVFDIIVRDMPAELTIQDMYANTKKYDSKIIEGLNFFLQFEEKDLDLISKIDNVDLLKETFEKNPELKMTFSKIYPRFVEFVLSNDFGLQKNQEEAFKGLASKTEGFQLSTSEFINPMTKEPFYYFHGTSGEYVDWRQTKSLNVVSIFENGLISRKTATGLGLQDVYVGPSITATRYSGGENGVIIMLDSKLSFDPRFRIDKHFDNWRSVFFSKMGFEYIKKFTMSKKTYTTAKLWMLYKYRFSLEPGFVKDILNQHSSSADLVKTYFEAEKTSDVVLELNRAMVEFEDKTIQELNLLKLENEYRKTKHFSQKLWSKDKSKSPAEFVKNNFYDVVEIVVKNDINQLYEASNNNKDIQAKELMKFIEERYSDPKDYFREIYILDSNENRKIKDMVLLLNEGESLKSEIIKKMTLGSLEKQFRSSIIEFMNQRGNKGLTSIDVSRVYGVSSNIAFEQLITIAISEGKVGAVGFEIENGLRVARFYAKNTVPLKNVEITDFSKITPDTLFEKTMQFTVEQERQLKIVFKQQLENKFFEIKNVFSKKKRLIEFEKFRKTGIFQYINAKNNPSKFMDNDVARIYQELVFNFNLKEVQRYKKQLSVALDKSKVVPNVKITKFDPRIFSITKYLIQEYANLQVVPIEKLTVRDTVEEKPSLLEPVINEIDFEKMSKERFMSYDEVKSLLPEKLSKAITEYTSLRQNSEYREAREIVFMFNVFSDKDYFNPESFESAKQLFKIYNLAVLNGKVDYLFDQSIIKHSINLLPRLMFEEINKNIKDGSWDGLKRQSISDVFLKIVEIDGFEKNQGFEYSELNELMAFVEKESKEKGLTHQEVAKLNQYSIEYFQKNLLLNLVNEFENEFMIKENKVSLSKIYLATEYLGFFEKEFVYDVSKISIKMKKGYLKLFELMEKQSLDSFDSQTKENIKKFFELSKDYKKETSVENIRDYYAKNDPLRWFSRTPQGIYDFFETQYSLSNLEVVYKTKNFIDLMKIRGILTEKSQTEFFIEFEKLFNKTKANFSTQEIESIGKNNVNRSIVEVVFYSIGYDENQIQEKINLGIEKIKLDNFEDKLQFIEELKKNNPQILNVKQLTRIETYPIFEPLDSEVQKTLSFYIGEEKSISNAKLLAYSSQPKAGLEMWIVEDVKRGTILITKKTSISETVFETKLISKIVLPFQEQYKLNLNIEGFENYFSEKNEEKIKILREVTSEELTVKVYENKARFKLLKQIDGLWKLVDLKESRYYNDYVNFLSTENAKTSLIEYWNQSKILSRIKHLKTLVKGDLELEKAVLDLEKANVELEQWRKDPTLLRDPLNAKFENLRRQSKTIIETEMELLTESNRKLVELSWENQDQWINQKSETQFGKKYKRTTFEKVNEAYKSLSKVKKEVTSIISSPFSRAFESTVSFASTKLPKSLVKIGSSLKNHRATYNEKIGSSGMLSIMLLHVGSEMGVAGEKYDKTTLKAGGLVSTVGGLSMMVQMVYGMSSSIIGGTYAGYSSAIMTGATGIQAIGSGAVAGGTAVGIQAGLFSAIVIDTELLNHFFIEPFVRCGWLDKAHEGCGDCDLKIQGVLVEKGLYQVSSEQKIVFNLKGCSFVDPDKSGVSPVILNIDGKEVHSTCRAFTEDNLKIKLDSLSNFADLNAKNDECNQWCTDWTSSYMWKSLEDSKWTSWMNITKYVGADMSKGGRVALNQDEIKKYNILKKLFFIHPKHECYCGDEPIITEMDCVGVLEVPKTEGKIKISALLGEEKESNVQFLNVRSNKKFEGELNNNVSKGQYLFARINVLTNSKSCVSEQYWSDGAGFSLSDSECNFDASTNTDDLVPSSESLLKSNFVLEYAKINELNSSNLIKFENNKDKLVVKIDVSSQKKIFDALLLCEKSFCSFEQLFASVQLRMHLLRGLSNKMGKSEVLDYSVLLSNAIENSIGVNDGFVSSNGTVVAFEGAEKTDFNPIWKRLKGELEYGVEFNLKYGFVTDTVLLQKNAELNNVILKLPEILFSTISKEGFQTTSFLTNGSKIYTNLFELPFNESCGKHVFYFNAIRSESNDFWSIQRKEKVNNKGCTFEGKENVLNISKIINPLNVFVVSKNKELLMNVSKNAKITSIPKNHFVSKNFDNESTNQFYTEIINEFGVPPRTVIVLEEVKECSETKINEDKVLIETELNNENIIEIYLRSCSQKNIEKVFQNIFASNQSLNNSNSVYDTQNNTQEKNKGVDVALVFSVYPNKFTGGYVERFTNGNKSTGFKRFEYANQREINGGYLAEFQSV